MLQQGQQRPPRGGQTTTTIPLLLLLLCLLPWSSSAFFLGPFLPSTRPRSSLLLQATTHTRPPTPPPHPPTRPLPIVFTEEEAERSSDLLSELDELAARGRYQEALALLKSGEGVVGAVHYHKVREGRVGEWVGGWVGGPTN